MSMVLSTCIIIWKSLKSLKLLEYHSTPPEGIRCAAEVLAAEAFEALNVTTVEEARALKYETIIKYIEKLRDGAGNPVPYITGANLDEHGVSDTFTTTTADYKEYVAGNYGDYANDFLSLYPAENNTQASLSETAPVRDQRYTNSSGGVNGYTYFWNYHALDIGTASHGSEFVYTLGNLWAQTGVNYTAEDCYVSNVLSSYWANIIKTTDPNSGTWRLL
ncbi:putative carboxylesterase protein [Botrytis fragariae]|uniref:Putative carboxylesterase protein n=1 Tax=Botrytis fragariae TaxID=1964551 RepID=A0A8H6AKA0_9HELO|nr:putative carboxylesterase protein [Botrytis fragariae]KAF5868924.1 putative carboxylesterase protein [Botrytis fragariae]